jgi:hypothetical protein
MKRCDKCGKESTEDVEVETYHIDITRQPFYDQGCFTVRSGLSRYVDWCPQCKKERIEEIIKVIEGTNQ